MVSGRPEWYQEMQEQPEGFRDDKCQEIHSGLSPGLLHHCAGCQGIHLGSGTGGRFLTQDV